MRTRTLAAVAIIGTATLALSLLRGQGTPTALTRPPKNLDKLALPQQATLLTAQRGADWLFRAHTVKGRFVSGYVPALKQEVEGDWFLRQAAAAAALGRAARYLGEDKYAARAVQTVLSLLEDTAPDPADPTGRVINLPGDPLYKLGMAGALLSAIGELPSPQKDVLDKAEQMCQSIRKQAQASGALLPPVEGASREAQAICPGLALMGVMKTNKHRPAAWKTDLAKKALPFYRAWFEKNRCTEFVPAMACAFAEAHLATKDKAMGEFVLELGGFAAKLQYVQIDRRRFTWPGGFMGYGKDGVKETEPTAEGAGLACALVEACRVARATGDASRHQQFAESAERALGFLAQLQYTDAGTQHFAPWFRPRIVGAFHVSPSDGNLRTDHTAWAVTAFAGFVEHVAH